MSEGHPAQYPVMLNVAGRLAVVIGGNASALRSARSLAKYGADVVVVTPEVSTELMNMEVDGFVTIEPRGYVRGDLQGAMIAVVASGSSETDAAVVAEARELNVLVNVQSDAAASSFIVPSVVQRGDLQIAISTAGRAPGVTRQVRRGIARAHGDEWGPYVQLVADLRALAVARTGSSESELGALFDFVAASDVLFRLHGGAQVTAESMYEEYVASLADEPSEGMNFSDE